ncbi:MAG: hypothetical protein ACYC90_12890 [Candidatus Nanopelagicales bacterium]
MPITPPGPLVPGPMGPGSSVCPGRTVEDGGEPGSGHRAERAWASLQRRAQRPTQAALDLLAGNSRPPYSAARLGGGLGVPVPDRRY